MKRTWISILMTVIAFALLLIGAGCAKAQPVHPNQINTFDGDAYDALTAAQAALNEAKSQYSAGKLPASAKAIINSTGAAYNTANASWKSWRDIVQGTKPGDAGAAQAQLTTDLAALSQSVANLKGVLAKP